MILDFKFQHPDGFSLVLFQPKFILQLVSQFSFEISASRRGPISAPGWLLLSVVPAKVGVFTQAEVFEVVPVGPHLHPVGDYYVDVHGDNGRRDD